MLARSAILTLKITFKPHNFVNLNFSFSNEVTLPSAFDTKETPGLKLPYLHSTISAGNMFFDGLAEDRAETLMTRIVIFAFLAGGGRVLESMVIVKASLVALLMHKLARTDLLIRAVSLSLNIL